MYNRTLCLNHSYSNTALNKSQQQADSCRSCFVEQRNSSPIRSTITISYHKNAFRMKIAINQVINKVNRQ